MTVAPGLRAEVQITVEASDTAIAVGSGDVPVLGTPRLLALAEQATVRAVEGLLPPGTTSVGTSVALEHRAASPIGATVDVTAELIDVDGRRLVFTVTALDGDTVAGTGRIERLVVDRDRFLARLAR
ncbi:thioesterase family protein [Rhizohabitans arisaemae]|uniref:thioesterase family protein n=1 Tax=Rhizohabitans arisaemae TaxID=2720610 RepID=UPI0024B18E62|nr:hotdog domain-containing protein [Rhizohabitans arisaemae]